jgi:vancomycin permeability regulator SanA
VYKQKFIYLAISILFLPVVLLNGLLLQKTQNQSTRVAMVLGAGLNDPETPSAILKNRLNESIDLYNSDKIDYIIVSGDNREAAHNEPKAMKIYLQTQGIPDSSIVSDFAGYRTIESCWRAKNVFKTDSIYLITQNFHLPRATYLCRKMGLKVKPVIAKNASYRGGLNGYAREVFASWSAIIEATGYTPTTQSDGTEQVIPQI